MSFAIALQSAIFYVVACTPCAQAREHRQFQKQAKKARDEKTRMHAEMPELYRHPDPFNTNPYWTEEIMMGPRPPTKKNTAASKATSERALNSAGRESRSTTASSIAVDSSRLGSSPTVVPEDGEWRSSITMSYSNDWNKKRYQREDEELWGHEDSAWGGHKLMDAIKQAGSSAGRIIEAKLGKEGKGATEEERANFYAPVRNPPVNDYHPPVVSQRPMHKDGARWMCQPPPPAKVMEGKVPVSRSMSMASQASRRTAASARTTGSTRTAASQRTVTSSRTAVSGRSPPGEELGLGKLMHEKMVEKKLRQGEMASEAELQAALNRRPSTARRNTTSSRGTKSQRSTRSRSQSGSSADVSGEETKKRRKPRRKLNITPESDDSDDEEFYRGNSHESSGTATHAAQRPKLQTIASSRAGSKRGSRGASPRVTQENLAPTTPQVKVDESPAMVQTTSIPVVPVTPAAA